MVNGVLSVTNEPVRPVEKASAHSLRRTLKQVTLVDNSLSFHISDICIVTSVTDKAFIAALKSQHKASILAATEDG
jgi:hypothetical protein